MTKAIIVGDVHISDRPPSSRTPGYTDQILQKVRFAAEEAVNHHCPLIFAGDIFHFKAPTKNSHGLVQRFHDILGGVRTFVVPGNHDMSGDRLDSLDTQPLGTLAHMENVSLLIGKDDELPDIVGIPYLTEFDSTEWKSARLESFRDLYCREAELIVTHAPIFPPGKAPGVYDSIDPHEWAEFFKDTYADHTYYGHIHDNHGIFEAEIFRTHEVVDEPMIHTFCNHGALSRGSLHEATINRKPAITYWDGDTFERIEVPHLPADEVFLFEQAQMVVQNKASAKEFAEALGGTQLTNLTLESITAILRQEVQDKRVLAVIEGVLEEVNGSH